MELGSGSRPVAFASRLIHGPRLQYLGLALVLTWNYSVWFVTTSFTGIHTLSTQLVISWLTAVFVSGIAPLVLAWRFDRGGGLPMRPWLIWTTAIIGALATACMIALGKHADLPWLSYLAAVIIGVTGSVMWLLWGQRLACLGAEFPLARVAPVFGGFLLAVLGLAAITPATLDPVLIALQPIASAGLLCFSLRTHPDCQAPRLLPTKTRLDARRPIFTITAISFFAALACYFTVAITPVVDPITALDNFGWGVPMGATLILVVAALRSVFTGGSSEFRAFPWLILLTIVACVAFLTDWELHAFAFVLALATSSLFEILLIAYMGVLSRSGYAAPTTAFALSRSAIRLGVGFASGLALLYATIPGASRVVVPVTFAVLATALAGFLITLVRQEYAIQTLTRAPQADSDLDAMVLSVAEEFGLSEREREIMTLIGQGYPASTVASKLVISPYTVNTHVQHIYAKLGIHKRSELIAYLRRNA